MGSRKISVRFKRGYSDLLLVRALRLAGDSERRIQTHSHFQLSFSWALIMGTRPMSRHCNPTYKPRRKRCEGSPTHPRPPPLSFLFRSRYLQFTLALYILMFLPNYIALSTQSVGVGPGAPQFPIGC